MAVMTHEEAREVLAALALDALEAAERGAALAHVAGCEVCNAELTALRQAAEQLAYAAAPMPMLPEQRERVKRRLLARAGAERPATRDELVAPRLHRMRRPRARRFISPQWAALAAGIVAVVSVMVATSARRRSDRAIAALTGPRVAVMSLVSTGPSAPSGRMFWDRERNTWTFVAHGLPRPRAGRVYQLWVVTPTAKIDMGTFMPQPNGEAMMQKTHALPAGTQAAIAVTEEPMGGSAQPTSGAILTS